MKKILTATLLSATVLASAANAEVSYYTQFNVGASKALSTQYHAARNDNKNTIEYNGELGYSAVLGAEFGAKLADHFRLGVSVDYRPEYSNDFKYNSDVTLKTSSLATMANAYFDITETSNGFTPYLTAGAGMAFNEQKITAYEKDLGAKKTSGFAWKAGLGTKVKLSDSFDMDIRYQFVDLGKVELQPEEGWTTTKSAKLKANEVLVGLAYRF